MLVAPRHGDRRDLDDTCASRLRSTQPRASTDPARTNRRPSMRPAAVEHDANRLGIEAVLFDEDPRRQRLDRVVVEHRHRRLQDDRAGVEIAVDEMDGRAGRRGRRARAPAAARRDRETPAAATGGC